MSTTIKSAALLSAAFLLTACGGEESDSSVSQNYHNIQTTLQGSIFNALDNSLITDESLEITLVQGSKYREAKVRTGTDDHAGDYSLSGIPTSANGGNISYRLTSSVDGYQPFEAIVAFNAATAGSLQDKTVNRIGNIYMYPLGTHASDITVNVTFNGEPVANATVLLNPNTALNLITTDTVSILARSNGLQEAQTAITDASGAVTFAAATLVLGGRYDIDVMPTTHEGSQLQVNRGALFTVGSATNIRNVAMSEAVPGTQNGLYITSSSNSDSDSAVVATGVLTFNFSRAISLVNEKTINATLAGTTVLAALDATTVDSKVTATVSADGKTLTLTPNFSTLPVPFAGSNSATADNDLSITYSSILLRLVDANDSSVTYLLDTTANSGDLVNQSGANPSVTVKITTDF